MTLRVSRGRSLVGVVVAIEKMSLREGASGLKLETRSAKLPRYYYDDHMKARSTYLEISLLDDLC